MFMFVLFLIAHHRVVLVTLNTNEIDNVIIRANGRLSHTKNKHTYIADTNFNALDNLKEI